MNLLIKLYAIVITLVFGYQIKDSTLVISGMNDDIYHVAYNSYLTGCLNNIQNSQNKSSVCYQKALEYSEPIKKF